MQQRLRIGTRGSPLALAQAHQVRNEILRFNPDLDAVEIVEISTKGDQILDRALTEIGGKGLFTEELEDQLRAGNIDLAVHSTKDMPTHLPDGLSMPIFLKRERVNDVLISRNGETLDTLPQGAVIGTASLRRGAQLLKYRPDFKIVTFRGNVQTRLRKLQDGIVDATLLAQAGLNRLDLAHVVSEELDVIRMLPAPAQGAIGIEVRANDDETLRRLEPLNHPATHAAVTAERAFLAALDGNCRTPIAALATEEGGMLKLQGRVLSVNGKHCFEGAIEGDMNAAADLGARLADRLKEQAGSTIEDILKEARG